MDAVVRMNKGTIDTLGPEITNKHKQLLLNVTNAQIRLVLSWANKAHNP